MIDTSGKTFTVIDNFYPDPSYLLSLIGNNFPNLGCSSNSQRSLLLEELDKNLYEQFYTFILNFYGIPRGSVKVTSFISRTMYNPENIILNEGYAHIDGRDQNSCAYNNTTYPIIAAGHVMLTPNPDPEATLQLYKLKPEVNWSEEQIFENCINNYGLVRDKYVNKDPNVTLDMVEADYNDYHSNFNLSCELKNVFNRLITWPAGTIHRSRRTSKNPMHLTQFFFIEKLD